MSDSANGFGTVEECVLRRNVDRAKSGSIGVGAVEGGDVFCRGGSPPLRFPLTLSRSNTLSIAHTLSSPRLHIAHNLHPTSKRTHRVRHLFLLSKPQNQERESLNQKATTTMLGSASSLVRRPASLVQGRAAPMAPLLSSRSSSKVATRALQRRQVSYLVLFSLILCSSHPRSATSLI